MTNRNLRLGGLGASREEADEEDLREQADHEDASKEANNAINLTFGGPRGFPGSALDPPPWRAERARGGAGGGPSADPRSPRGPPKVYVYGVFSSSMEGWHAPRSNACNRSPNGEVRGPSCFRGWTKPPLVKRGLVKTTPGPSLAGSGP